MLVTIMAVWTKDKHYQMIYYDVIKGEKIFIEGNRVTIIWAIKHQNIKLWKNKKGSGPIFPFPLVFFIFVFLFSPSNFLKLWFGQEKILIHLNLFHMLLWNIWNMWNSYFSTSTYDAHYCLIHCFFLSCSLLNKYFSSFFSRGKK